MGEDIEKSGWCKTTNKIEKNKTAQIYLIPVNRLQKFHLDFFRTLFSEVDKVLQLGLTDGGCKHNCRFCHLVVIYFEQEWMNTKVTQKHSKAKAMFCYCCCAR